MKTKIQHTEPYLIINKFHHPLGLLLALLALAMTPGVGWGQTNITALSSITNSDGHYVITQDITGGTPGVANFNGILEAAINTSTKMPYRIKNLEVPLFTTLTGTVKNLVLEGVAISGHSGKTGAIACTANGDARIYNVGILSGEVGGTKETGGLVGFLDGNARVVNCYSYANITGGTDVGGIVGYNNKFTNSRDLWTMVMNCMFYGDITGGESKAPIYNGKIISNKEQVKQGSTVLYTGVSNFNYFRAEASFMQDETQTSDYVYNCALMAETRFLQRFEFYRHLLNSHRELAGWWATGTYSADDMMKWVLEPSQLNINSEIQYPVLKACRDQNENVIKYPSVVNIDADHAEAFSSDPEIRKTQRNQGRKFGTLTVTIQMDDVNDNTVPYHHPNGAALSTTSLTPNITDKDPNHFNFNYYKVQLPYYNDVGTKNYNGNRVVTGWKIVSITGGTAGSFTPGADAPSYNFADRHCTNKDLYGEGGSNRVFNQGAYWDVPEGVTAITIEPYWAKAAYVSDAYPDVVYKTDMSGSYNVPNVGGGQKYTNGNEYPIAGEQQKVYTTVANAVSALSPDASHTVNDYAVVLVGNVHQYFANNAGIGGDNKYTVTTIDLDHDNEPDYSFMLTDKGRNRLHPLKWDFLNLVGLGMAQKSTGGTGTYNIGILQPIGWFESTNTSLFRVTQFEYDRSDRGEAPYIVQGGVMEQWVSGQNNGAANKTTYFHVGGNVWFKEFHRGTHQDKQLKSKHPPVSVTGGDYDEFYLTGLYRGDVANYEDNAECYINGGRFGVVAGAAMEGIGKANGANNTGNITWQIQNADMEEFYAGGINAAHPVEGNLTTVIEGGYIKQFCGGPKFGDMNTGKTVTTNATDCIFGKYFGAGYGGNSYSRRAPANRNNVINLPGPGKVNNVALDLNSWNEWLSDEYRQDYNATYGGVSTQFNYQFLPMSSNVDNVCRLFIEYVKFSMAKTRSVTSILNGCTVDSSFYGGGSLGKVDGEVTSVLDGCIVKGNVFGAGYSASCPTVEVDGIGFMVEPYYYDQLGTYRIAQKGPTTTYTWDHKDEISTTSDAIDTDTHILYTTESLEKSNLGSVSGNVTLILKGNTTVGTTLDGGGLKPDTGNVYGGGDESHVTKNAGNGGNTTVILEDGVTVRGNVYGGGNSGPVEGNSEVKIQNQP